MKQPKLEYLRTDKALLPYYSLGQQNAESIHFTGANGFPVLVYQHFLNQFSTDHRVVAADCRGASKQRNTPPQDFGFNGLASDLITVIENTHSAPVIGMGHSFGAHVTLLASIRRPDLFKKLILIEPASLPNRILDSFYRHLPTWLLHRMVPMIKNTLQRKRTWSSRDSFKSRYKSHPTFKHFTTQSMESYAQSGLTEDVNGRYELVFDPIWEAYIFSQVEYIWKNLKNAPLLPTLFIKAEHSYLYSSQTFHRENKKLSPEFIGIEVANTYHMIPLEDPEACTDAIRTWL
ncbi:alpha/beta hydrolase [Arenicella sp. 4NH20-0111]|uniref:alpha/beta fold hydrolase n=1 Tax=Arenicella sp. 4NH20-0111 TaxID=3127648 RepID=UPI00310248B0